MKRWIIYIVGVLAAVLFSRAPNPGIDVAKLKPVELLRVRTAAGAVLVETDTGDFGLGSDLLGALSDLRESTAGAVFLETADYVILPSDWEDLALRLTEYLRPGCHVCVSEAELDLPSAAAYLNVHSPELSLNDCRAGKTNIAYLTQREGRLYLES